MIQTAWNYLDLWSNLLWIFIHLLQKYEPCCFRPNWEYYIKYIMCPILLSKSKKFTSGAHLASRVWETEWEPACLEKLTNVMTYKFCLSFIDFFFGKYLQYNFKNLPQSSWHYILIGHVSLDKSLSPWASCFLTNK